MFNHNLVAQATEQNPHAILMTDLSGNIVYINARFTAITGYSFEEIVGKNPRILYFYPKDDTAGCTKEACNFRDSREEFLKRGVAIVGMD